MRLIAAALTASLHPMPAVSLLIVRCGAMLARRLGLEPGGDRRPRARLRTMGRRPGDPAGLKGEEIPLETPDRRRRPRCWICLPGEGRDVVEDPSGAYAERPTDPEDRGHGGRSWHLRNERPTGSEVLAAEPEPEAYVGGRRSGSVRRRRLRRPQVTVDPGHSRTVADLAQKAGRLLGDDLTIR